MHMTLKAARVNKGFTQRQAADLIGVSESTILNYEKIKKKPTIIKLLELYGIINTEIFFMPICNDETVQSDLI